MTQLYHTLEEGVVQYDATVTSCIGGDSTSTIISCTAERGSIFLEDLFLDDYSYYGHGESILLADQFWDGIM